MQSRTIANYGLLLSRDRDVSDGQIFLLISILFLLKNSERCPRSEFLSLDPHDASAILTADSTMAKRATMTLLDS